MSTEHLAVALMALNVVTVGGFLSAIGWPGGHERKQDPLPNRHAWVVAIYLFTVPALAGSAAYLHLSPWHAYQLAPLTLAFAANAVIPLLTAAAKWTARREVHAVSG